MATLRDPDALQPVVNPHPAIGGDRPGEQAADGYELSAEDLAAIEAGERDADAGRFVSDEEMAKLIPGW